MRGCRGVWSANVLISPTWCACVWDEFVRPLRAEFFRALA